MNIQLFQLLISCDQLGAMFWGHVLVGLVDQESSGANGRETGGGYLTNGSGLNLRFEITGTYTFFSNRSVIGDNYRHQTSIHREYQIESSTVQ